MKRLFCKSILIGALILVASVAWSFYGNSPWTISIGSDRVIEFQSEKRISYCNRRYAFVVAGQPDRIFLSPEDERSIKALRQGLEQMGYSPDIFILDENTATVEAIPFEQFLKLDIVFEDLPVGGPEKYPDIDCAGDPEGHSFNAPIRKKGREFVAVLSSDRKTFHKYSCCIPGIIPFFGRSQWIQKEPYHSGTLFLEIFDTEHPERPVARLEKTFKDVWLLPSIFDMACWVQGTEAPMLVVADNESTLKNIPGRVLLIRPAFDTVNTP